MAEQGLTFAQARELKPGDWIERNYAGRYAPGEGRRWVRCEVVNVEIRGTRPAPSGEAILVSFRMPGMKGDFRAVTGRLLQPQHIFLYPGDVERLYRLPLDKRLDATQANVYADWLAEQGFDEAAELLRAAFPGDLGPSPAAQAYEYWRCPWPDCRNLATLRGAGEGRKLGVLTCKACKRDVTMRPVEELVDLDGLNAKHEVA